VYGFRLQNGGRGGRRRRPRSTDQKLKVSANQRMSIRSMTGFAQVKSHVGEGTSFTLSLKSVNHRFLDPQLRLPLEMDELEMKLRRMLKDRLARGHVEVTLVVERRGGQGYEFNRELVGGYVAAFRKAANEFGTTGEPDLNNVFRMPG